MATLIAALVFTLVVTGFVTLVTYFIKNEKAEQVVGHIFSTHDLEEAKKYAELFGLDNTVEVNIEELLEMGRKMEAYLGSDKTDELYATVIRAKMDRYCYQYPESRSIHHRINIMMRAHNLVSTTWASVFIHSIIKSVGGGRNDEAINRY
jgi:hypothetical protein